MSNFADTPAPPYYAVIFSSLRTTGDEEAYSAMAARMLALAAQQPGYLGVESVRDGLGITVSYWESLEAVKKWRTHVEHLEAQRLGRHHWYADFRLRIAKVEQDYGM